MRKPENFHKIDNEIIKLNSVECKLDETKDGFFIFGNYWNNAVLFEMDWDNDQYNIKICVIGEGIDGWYIHEKLPIPKSLMKTLSSFKEFVVINMIDVASKVDLMDVTPNNDGVTELSSPEISHLVPSSSGPGLQYEVIENVGGIKDLWSCTCPAYQYSKATPQTCKHILQIQ